VVRKIVITTVVGAISFPLTNVLFQSFAEQLAMSAGVGGLILIVQFLIDVEGRLAVVEAQQTEQADDIKQAVESGFSKINDATALFSRIESIGLKEDIVTHLAQQAAELGEDAPPLVKALMGAEFDRLAWFLDGLANKKEVTYEGEDREWLLALTRIVGRSIDAVSMPSTDGGGQIYHGGFWGSDLGHRYLDLQHDAVRRGVRVRRLFVIERPELADDPDLLQTCRNQAYLGVDVRWLFPGAVPRTREKYLHDFTVFDDALSYEITPVAQIEEGENPLFLHTRLMLDPVKVRERKERYAEFWDSARPLP
jgi:hypothetical protein